jgi:hypothetical protein
MRACLGFASWSSSPPLLLIARAFRGRRRWAHRCWWVGCLRQLRRLDLPPRGRPADLRKGLPDLIRLWHFHAAQLRRNDVVRTKTSRDCAHATQVVT